MFYAIDREKEGIVDEWDGETILKNTQLALTNIKPPYNQDVEIINLETAESCGECFGQGSVHDDNFNGLTICPKCLGLRKKLNITSTQE